MLSGNTYQGQFKDGKCHGLGEYTWVSGASYKGEWLNGMRNGKGK